MKEALIIVPFQTEATAVRKALSDQWKVEWASTSEKGLKILSQGSPDLIVADLRQPRVKGEAFLVRLRTLAPWTPILVTVSEDTRVSSGGFLEKGATDLVSFPLSPEEFRSRVEGAMARQAGEIPSRLSAAERLILSGDSPLLEEVREQIDVVARTELPVLILGESGTGKEVVARQIHSRSSRSENPFLAVNCAAISESLFETELFGHVKGAFTGATDTRQGLLEAAQGGTLFLDEVFELPPPLQAKLLRVMQESEYLRVGDTQIRSLNIRMIYATNKDPATELKAKRIREDFYYRLQVFPIRMPSLRERVDDIPVLAVSFLRHYCEDLGKPFEGLDREATDALMYYPWPGNIRELQNRMRFAALYLKAPILSVEDLPAELQHPADQKLGSFARAKLEFERNYVTLLMRKHRGNINRVAKEAGLHRMEIYRILKRCRLKPEQFRGGV
ncbi:MAG: sigma-54 dependent transcriptional regulator [Acidobacteriota bacterium]